MNKLILIFLVLPSLLMGQGIVVDGAYFNVDANTEVNVDNAGVTNQNGDQINNTGTIYLDQNWTQTGAPPHYAGTGWMWFEGTVDQTISSVSALTVPKLRIDNGQKLILGSEVTVSTEVDLMHNGNIELGTNNLIVASGAAISNYDDNNFIITNSTGYLQQEVGGINVVFPVGNSGYNPATLNNIGTTDHFQVRVDEVVYDNGTMGTPETQGVVDRTWYIDEATIGGSDVTMTLQWAAGEELTGFDRIQSGIAHWNGATWDYPTAYTNATANGSYWTQTQSSQMTFSPFTVMDVREFLPVELLAFKAERVHIGAVQLSWTTETETNNKGFFVERMLANETKFSTIGWLDGNETTVQTQYYDLLDNNSYSGIAYYRLKQVDGDGSFSYSFVRAVEGMASNTDVTLFPNPTEDFINIRFGTLTAEKVDIRIFAANGQLMFQKQSTIDTDHILHLEETSEFPVGAYMMQMLLDDGTQLTKKFIKSRF